MSNSQFTRSGLLRPGATFIVAGGAALLMLGGVGTAHAAIPGANGVITGCYNNTTGTCVR